MSRILIIDDDRHMRSVCARVLANAGHTVACAENGEEGFAAIRNAAEPFDAVLLDQLMPVMSGTDVLEQIQSLYPNLPVIIITGSAPEETIKELIRNGARGCLPKPFTPEQLRNAVQKARR